MRHTMLALVTGVVVGLMGAQVEAFNLTGTWKGTQTCHFFTASGQEDTQIFQDDVLAITQSGTSVRIFMESIDFLYTGRAFTVPSLPIVGEVAFRLCGTSDDLTQEGEMGRAEILIRPTPQPGHFEATSIVAEHDEVDTCEWDYQRTSTANPHVPSCEQAAAPVRPRKRRP